MESRELLAGLGRRVVVRIAAVLVLGVIAAIFYGTGPHTVSDKEADFSLKVPRGWTHVGGEKFLWRFNKRQQAGLAVLEFIFLPSPDTPAKPTLNDLGDFLMHMRSQGLCNVITDKERMQVGGLEAFRFNCTGAKMVEEGRQSLPGTAQAVMVFRQSKGVYVLVLSCSGTSLSTYRTDFYQVVASFHSPAQ